MSSFRKHFILIALAVFFSGNTHTQTLRMTTKAHPMIDSVVQSYLHQKWLSGAVALVVKDGAVVHFQAYGTDHLEPPTSLDRNAIFRIASQTKAIVTVAVMILVEEGLLSLDAPLSAYIPEFANPRVIDQFHAADTTFTTVPANREITLRDLLTHTSGIDYPSIGSPVMQAIYAKNNISTGLDAPAGLTLAANMRALGRLPLVHQPGARWTYGHNLDVVGYLIEMKSGVSLEAFLQQRICQPLGMKDTYFNLPADRQMRLTELHTEDSLEHTTVYPTSARVNPNFPNKTKTYFSGGGGMSSTALDYAIFLQMVLNKGRYNGVQILKTSTVEQMLQNQVGDLSLGPHKFGLGFQLNSGLDPDDPRSAGSFSWGGIFGTSYWADPKTGIIGLLLTQQLPSSHGSALERAFQQAVYRSESVRK